MIFVHVRSIVGLAIGNNILCLVRTVPSVCISMLHLLHNN